MVQQVKKHLPRSQTHVKSWIQCQTSVSIWNPSTPRQEAETGESWTTTEKQQETLPQYGRRCKLTPDHHVRAMACPLSPSYPPSLPFSYIQSTFISKDQCLNFIYVSVCGPMHIAPQRLEEYMKTPGDGVSGGSELPNMNGGYQTWTLHKSRKSH